MVSLPGWGGRWMPRERLESDGGEIAKNRYKLVHPRVHHVHLQTGDGTEHSVHLTLRTA